MVRWDLIDKLVKAQRLIPANKNVESLRQELELWWCMKYTRPFKDPLLKEYTINELIYEFLTYLYLDPENDPKEQKEKEKQESDDEKWIREQLAKKTKPKEVKDAPQKDLPEIYSNFVDEPLF